MKPEHIELYRNGVGMKKKEDIPIERVREILEFDPETGHFTWKYRKPTDSSGVRTTNSWNTRYAGRRADRSRARDGYLEVQIANSKYLSHRLAWFYVHGAWPKQQIDHINGIPSDNRICNLRDVSEPINNQNIRKPRKDNKSCYLGVYFDKKVGRYRAQLRLNGLARVVGWFDCPKEAHQAYLDEKRRAHEGCTI